MSLVLKLNGVVFNNPNLPTLSGASLVAGNLLDVELGAIAHYLFGGGAYSYNDMSAYSNDIVPVNSDPAFTENSVLTTRLNSLDTGIELPQGSEATIICVFKNKGVSSMPWGSMIGGGTNGVSLFTSASGNAIYLNGRAENLIGQIALENLSEGHVFAACSIGNDQQILYSPQAADSVKGVLNKVSAVGANAYAQRNIYVGSGHYETTFSNDEVCEFILIDKALNEHEIEQVYQRSKFRMAKRGITI